jgi:hypothetical protein
MPRKSAALVALEEKYAKALETINQLTLNQAMLSAHVGAARQHVPQGQLVVGIRNVSNYTVSFTDKTSGVPVEYTLHPEMPGLADPNTRAVISKQVAEGLLIRDDSVLGTSENAAPADRLGDLPPEAQYNVILNAREWITSRTEQELRDDIAKITSGPSLRRLMYAVDQEVISAGEKYAGMKDRATRAVRDLPAVFRMVDELADERMDQLNPVSKVRHLERGDLAEKTPALNATR